MGLSSGLHDVSGAAPLPLLLLASLASALASLFSVVSSPAASSATSTNPNTTGAASSARFSGLDALVALADYLAASCVSTADGAAAGDCTVCLSAIAEGERVRTLACRHAFHAACLDGWFDQSSLSCPLCRAGPARSRSDADPM
ncbi:unnamed protein product [Urochloa humidicola]